MPLIRIRGLFGALFFGLAGVLPCFAAGRGDSVVVIYNSAMAESKDVANHYARQRAVPSEQVMGFDLPKTEGMSRADFTEKLQKPLAQWLGERGLMTFKS